MINLLFLLFLFPKVLAFWEPGYQMRGISFFGLETDHRGFMCDWVHPVDFYVNEINRLGFNLIRIPFSYQYVTEGNLGFMDHIVSLGNMYNITILLDFHRVWSNTQQPTPFDFGMTQEQFEDTWLLLLNRYKHEPSVSIHNSYNEYVPNNTNYLISYSKRLFERVERELPERYIHAATGTLWSGNLRGVNLEDLTFSNRIYYSIHKYSFSGTADVQDWDNSFGNVGLPTEKIVVGEWGWIHSNPSQVEWAKSFINYLKDKNIKNTIYWSLSQSGDTGNLYQNDCVTFNWESYELLKTLWQ